MPEMAGYPRTDAAQPTRVRLSMPANSEILDPDVGVLNEAQAAKYLSLSVFTLRRLREARTGPKVLQLSPRRIGYRKASLEAWLAKREEAQEAVS